MAEAPVPQTFALGQQAIPCKQVSPDGQHWVPQGVVPEGQAAHLRSTQLPLQH